MSATKLKNASNVDGVSATNAKTTSTQEDDLITIRIPKRITIEMPRPFQLEIPQWVVNTVILTGSIAVLHLITGGAIWRFWWLIFFVMPWLTDNGYSCGKSTRKSSSGQTSQHNQKPKHSHGKPDASQEMYV